MAPILYGLDINPPFRASLMTIQALNIDVQFKEVSTLIGENLTPEYLELNPLHTVPTLKDGDFIIWDSHAINAYLVGKHGKNDSLYPKDLQKRAVVDQRMYFDVGILFNGLLSVLMPVFREGATSIDKVRVADVDDGKKIIAISMLNGYSVILSNDKNLKMHKPLL